MRTIHSMCTIFTSLCWSLICIWRRLSWWTCVACCIFGTTCLTSTVACASGWLLFTMRGTFLRATNRVICPFITFLLWRWFFTFTVIFGFCLDTVNFLRLSNLTCSLSFYFNFLRPCRIFLIVFLFWNLWQLIISLPWISILYLVVLRIKFLSCTLTALTTFIFWGKRILWREHITCTAQWPPWLGLTHILRGSFVTVRRRKLIFGIICNLSIVKRIFYHWIIPLNCCRLLMTVRC